MAMTTDLIPADSKRCQTEIRQPHHPFRLGGQRPKPERCLNTPVMIAREVKPGADGLCGEMSVCQSCAGELWKDLDLRERVQFVPLPKDDDRG